MMPTVTNYLWDPVDDCVVTETNSTGSVTVTYTHESGRFGPLVSENRSGAEFYHHYDALGSTTTLTNDAGNVTDSFGFDACGNPTSRLGTTSTPYQWIGRLGYHFDLAFQLQLVRARNFDPRIARWSSRDPIGFMDGPNLYAYVNNRPTNESDPSGLDGGLSYDLGPTPEYSCAVTTKENGKLSDRWEQEAKLIGGPVLSGACNGKEIIDFVKKNHCCGVTIFGHQGGAANTGGVVTNCDGGDSVRLLPDTCLQSALAAAFAWCRGGCKLNINSCGASVGDPNFDEFEGTVQSIANSTGCTVTKVTGVHICGASSDEPPIKKKPQCFGRTIPPDRGPNARARPPVAKPCR